jgi:hypothetical protein
MNKFSSGVFVFVCLDSEKIEREKISVKKRKERDSVIASFFLSPFSHKLFFFLSLPPKIN